MVIRRVDPISCAKVMAAVHAAFGLLLGACFTLVGLAVGSGIASASDDLPFGPGMGMLFGVGAILLLPIFYGIAGFVGGAIGALIYNMAAGVVGGLQVDIGDRVVGSGQ